MRVLNYNRIQFRMNHDDTPIAQAASKIKLSWETITALGRPVVPEVNTKAAQLPGLTAAAAASREASPPASSRPRWRRTSHDMQAIWGGGGWLLGVWVMECLLGMVVSSLSQPPPPPPPSPACHQLLQLIQREEPHPIQQYLSDKEVPSKEKLIEIP
jgi:hypothetical protein